MQKHRRNLSFVLFCLFMLPIAHAQNDVPSHPVDGEYIKEWLLLGPFFPDDLDKDFLVGAGGEANVHPEEGDAVISVQGDTLRWRWHFSRSSIINLDQAVTQRDSMTVYAFSILQSAAEEKVQFLLGSNNGVAVWINGEQVHHNPVDRNVTVDEDVFEASLKAGANRCLIKITEIGETSGFAVRAFPVNRPVAATPVIGLWVDRTGSISQSGISYRWLGGQNWKYHSGDNADWADPEFDDTSWEKMNLWFSPNNLPKGVWNGIGWFRLHLAVDSTLWNRPLAMNVRQGGASEIYLDGRLLAQFGKVGSSKRDEEGYVATNRDFLPPPKSILFGKTNHVIAVRFSNFYLKEEYPHIEQGLEITLSDLNSTITSSAAQKRANTIIQMVFTIVPVVFAILHLLLFLFYQRAKENLYYALFTLTLGAASFAFFQYTFSLVTDLREILLFAKLAGAINPFLYIAFLRFSYALFYPRLPKQFWIFLLIGAGIATRRWGYPLSEPLDMMVFIMIALLEVLRVAVVAIRRKKDGAWIVGTGFIFFAVAIFCIYFYVILTTMAILPFSFNFFITTSSLGIFGLLLSMSVFLSRNFARTTKNLEEQLVQVKELSEKAITQERERAHLEAENARKTKELEEARQLQLSMLPKELPQLPHLEIGVFMKTATEVGGDYYDFHLADNGTLTVAIGDATGHGMKAGTMVAATKSLFNSLAGELEPLQILKKGTKAIKAMGLKKMFMALTIAKFKEHHMQVAAAGMPFTLIYRSSTDRVEEVALKGMPLGGFGNFPYKDKNLHLSAGDTVLFMSDGLEEMFNPQDEILGEEQVKVLFEETAADSPEEIIEHLKKAGEAWANGRAQQDDVTFVVVKIK